MANIFECIVKSDCRRPVYTSYELSAQVRDKRKMDGLTLQAFANNHNISIDILEQIEEGTRSFSPQLYKVCAKILDLSIDDLIEENIDDLSVVNFRTTDNSEGISDTFNLANKLFNEIIMQQKIGVN